MKPLTRITRCSVQYLCISNPVESSLTLIVWITSRLNILGLESYVETLMDVHYGSFGNETSG